MSFQTNYKYLIYLVIMGDLCMVGITVCTIVKPGMVIGVSNMMSAPMWHGFVHGS